MKVTDELFQKQIIDKTYQDTILKETDDFIVSIDSISINELLSNLNLNEGIILINNYPNKINYLDFEEIEFKENKIKNFKKLIENKKKVIVKTNDINIMAYLEFVDYTINIYQNINEINYFYDVNKRLD